MEGASLKGTLCVYGACSMHITLINRSPMSLKSGYCIEQLVL